MKVNFKRYFLYLCRWQLSTPILAIVLVWLSSSNQWVATVVANLIGGLIFFWVDRFIFRTPILDNCWDVRESIKCSDCGKMARGYRLVRTKNYDKSSDKTPEFRCEECSSKKSEKLKQQGVDIQ